MSEGVTASVSGSVTKRHVSRERVLRGLGGRFPQGGTIDTDEKNSPMVLEKTVKGSRHASPRAKEKDPRSLRTEGLTA